MTVITTHIGTNADLIVAVAELYAKDGLTIADVTYGRGAFWRKIDLNRFEFLPTDILPKPPAKYGNFMDLPYEPNSIDIVILDPPYIHNPGTHMTDARYANAATTKNMYHVDIMEMYKKGMSEAWRITRVNGQLWVKCKDQVESGQQRWSHIDIFNNAKAIGFYAKDLFVLIPTSRVSHNRWARQLHARKTHSYLWVFNK